MFLDGGTTILPMLDILKDRKITIVTHSALIVEAFREGTARLFVLPGDFDTYYSMFTGPVTGQILSVFILTSASSAAWASIPGKAPCLPPRP